MPPARRAPSRLPPAPPSLLLRQLAAEAESSPAGRSVGRGHRSPPAVSRRGSAGFQPARAAQPPPVGQELASCPSRPAPPTTRASELVASAACCRSRPPRPFPFAVAVPGGSSGGGSPPVGFRAEGTFRSPPTVIYPSPPDRTTPRPLTRPAGTPVPVLPGVRKGGGSSPFRLPPGRNLPGATHRLAPVPIRPHHAPASDKTTAGAARTEYVPRLSQAVGRGENREGRVFLPSRNAFTVTQC